MVGIGLNQLLILQSARDFCQTFSYNQMVRNKYFQVWSKDLGLAGIEKI